MEPRNLLRPPPSCPAPGSRCPPRRGHHPVILRQRLVPQQLQGRIASVNMVGVYGGMLLGQALGGVIAQLWGLTAPWWFAFGGSAITLVLVWRQVKYIAAARPASPCPAPR